MQVIQPTPVLSPSGSESALYDRPKMSSPNGARLAPLASISSCQVTSVSIAEVASDCHSIGSDSVFLDEECMDTEDEAEEFSTDSDVDDYGPEIKRHFISKKLEDYSPSSVPFAEHLQVSNYPKTMAGRFHATQPIRRYSSPSHKSESTLCERDEPFPICSRSCDTFADNNIANRPPFPLPETSSSETIDNTAEPARVEVVRTLPLATVNEGARPTSSLSCDHLVKALTEHSRLQTSSVRDLVEHCSWSQETLF